MPERELRETLQQLQRELAGATPLDPESRRLLEAIADDIETRLAQSDPEPEDESLVDRLRGATEEFEESHPELTAIVGRIADLLARMGI